MSGENAAKALEIPDQMVSLEKSTELLKHTIAELEARLVGVLRTEPATEAAKEGSEEPRRRSPHGNDLYLIVKKINKQTLRIETITDLLEL